MTDIIFVMLFTHDKWRHFTSRPIPLSSSSEVMLCVSLSRHIMNKAAVHGGTADINPVQDHGLMLSQSGWPSMESHVDGP
ncbi:hypothetical protein [Marinobacter sp. 2_MG-2023]|uniref:hypothetical protein n=1 Tax=Marinobacter sp. 2_MG-2023 TaxID=3062679 RepID=UPI0026E1B6B0|nr:hypothetical protein [Marinobacter sp. 2_MG-2023]MDO6440541.1 hypothetical protein [Marinobacter sp. 2_MG-2023]